MPAVYAPFAWSPGGPDTIVLGDNLAVTALLPDAAFRLIYLDPPFNTGRVQRRQRRDDFARLGQRRGDRAQTLVENGARLRSPCPCWFFCC
jgi:16S rRNA G966 N2-methylase RsmD